MSADTPATPSAEPIDATELLLGKVRAIRNLHAVEMFGDCVEDGEPYPCKTIRILNFDPNVDLTLANAADDARATDG